MRMDLNVRVPDAPLIEMRGIVKTYNVGKPNELEIRTAST